jgi:hypothetical protein
MKIVESILTKNPCYTAGKKITVKGLMLHSVGCAQPKASAFVNNWNRADFKSACVHAFVDGETGDVYQTLPWNHRGWHCGSGVNGSANNTHIGVEMCEPACIKYTSGSSFTCSDKESAMACVKRTYEAAVELFAFLCEKYGLDPTADGVVISHSEGYARGVASNHGDPVHLWKGLGLSYTMDGFRKDVKAAMDGGSDASGSESAAATSSAGTALLGMTNADCPFVVKVSISDLNIRKGAGTNTAKTGKYTGIGSFTIVAVKSGKGSDKGWGKLKSGAGWISLDYCEKVL